MKSLALTLLVSLALYCGVSVAQQPGSPQYNSVYLPAHGAGDTDRRDGLESRFGAMAGSPVNSRSGWVVDRPSREAANRDALEMCEARGGIDCVVEFKFENSCGAVATSAERHVTASDRTLGVVKRKVLKSCGRDCRILWEGCSLAARTR